MSVFTTLITGSNSANPIAVFTTLTLLDAANVVNVYLSTLGNIVDVTREFVNEMYASPHTFSNLEPPRADGLLSFPDVGFNYKNVDDDDNTLAFRVHTTIHDRVCHCSIHKPRENTD
jgi:hypothetical protein